MYYKKCLNKINKIVMSLCFILAITLTSFAGLQLNSKVYATDSLDKSSLITNYDFSSDSVSTSNYMVDPSSWSKVNPNSLNVDDNNSLFMGVMNPTTTISASKTQDEYGLDTVPTGTSSNILLLNSTSSSVTYGYKSSSFTLDKNSYYKLTVRAESLGGVGYIVINDLSSGKESYLRVDDRSWENYTFFFSTSTTISESLSISLLLGKDTITTAGAVAYDYAKLEQLSESRYGIENSNKDTEYNKVISLKSSEIDTLEDFENGIDTWIDTTKQPAFEVNDPSTTLHIMDTKEVSLNNTGLSALGIKQPNDSGNSSTKALLIYNKEDSYQTLKSNLKTLDRNARYKLTVLAKSECNTGSGANIVVTDNDTSTSANLSVSTTTTTNATKNNWSEYTFYITTSSKSTNNIYIELSLGTSDSKTNGYVWFDDITLEKVSDTDITNNSSNSNTTTLDLETYTAGTISNYDFNKTTNQNSTTTYPLKATNWTYTGDYEDKSGIISTNISNWKNNQNNYLNATNPGVTPNQLSTYNQNHALMIANDTITNSSYKSDSFTLSANSYYCIQFEMQTQINSDLTSTNQGVTMSIENSDSETIYKVADIKNVNQEWITYKAYIHTGDSEETCTITLALNGVMGYAFFDNLITYTYTADDDGTCTTFDSTYSTDTNSVKKLIDLSTINFDNYDTNFYSQDKINTPYKWTGNLSSGSDVALDTGIVKNTQSKNVLQIRKVGLHVYYTYTYNKAISLTSGTYYKISLNITTESLTKDVDTVADDDGVYAYGVYVKLATLDKTINIKNNEIADYTFYIYASADTSSVLSVSLGNEDALTSGLVQVNSVSIETMESSAFTTETTDLDLDHNILVANTDTTDEDTTDDTTDTFSASDINWLIIPSIILSLSIIIAVVGYSVRQIKIRRKPRIKTSYDRRKTIDVELNKQQRIDVRKTIITDLQQEMDSIDNEIAEIKAQFDAMEKTSTLNHTKLIESFRVEKEAVEQEHKKAIEEYKESIRTLDSDKEKERSEKKFARYINELQAKENALSLKMENKDKNAEIIRAKRDAQIARYIEQKMLIAQEIEKVQAEIEEIAREDAEVWSEYQRAKEEAKQEKLKYIAEKRKYKQYVKEQKKNSKSLDQSNETSNDDSTENK